MEVAAAGQNILPRAMILKDLPKSDDCFSFLLYPFVIMIYPVISIILIVNYICALNPKSF